MSVKKFDYGEFSIVDTALGSADATFVISATTSNRKGQNSGGGPQYYEIPDLTMVNFTANISEKGGTRKETIGIASVADASNDQTDGRKRYTVTFRLYDDASTKMRGVKQNNDGTNALANQDTDLIVTNFPVGSLVKIVWDTAELTKTVDGFVANSGEDSAVLGETIVERVPVVASSVDNKIYNYDSTDSNLNYVGILKTGEGGTAGQTKTYTTTNGTSTGHGGLALTPGAKIYVDNSALISESKTGTSQFTGILSADATSIVMGTETETTVFNADEFEVVDPTDGTKKATKDVSAKTTGTVSNEVFQGGAQTITFQADSHTVAKQSDIVDFGTGADGALSVPSGTTNIALDTVKNYTSINIAAGATLSTAGTNGIMFIKCTGNVTIEGTIDLGSKGAAGGIAVSGSSTGATDGNVGTDSDSSLVTISVGQLGGGGGDSASDNSATGGGGASSVGRGRDSLAAGTSIGGFGGLGIGPNFGKDFLPLPGSGGGSGGAAGGGTSTWTSGAGGIGGGALYIACGGILTINNGTINLNGAVGGNGAQSGSGRAGGGSGGAGGAAFLVYETSLSETTPTYNISAGAAGTGVGTNGTDGGQSSDGILTIVPRQVT